MAHSGAFYALLMTSKDLIVTQHEPKLTTESVLLYERDV